MRLTTQRPPSGDAITGRGPRPPTRARRDNPFAHGRVRFAYARRRMGPTSIKNRATGRARASSQPTPSLSTTAISRPSARSAGRTPLPVAGAGSVSGRDAIEKMLRDNVIVYGDGTPRTKHVTTNLAIEVDEAGGTAASRSYFTALQALPDLALQPIISGRYLDRFERRDGHGVSWRGAFGPISSAMSADIFVAQPPTSSPAPRAPLSVTHRPSKALSSSAQRGPRFALRGEQVGRRRVGAPGHARGLPHRAPRALPSCWRGQLPLKRSRGSLCLR